MRAIRKFKNDEGTVSLIFENTNCPGILQGTTFAFMGFRDADNNGIDASIKVEAYKADGTQIYNYFERKSNTIRIHQGHVPAYDLKLIHDFGEHAATAKITVTIYNPLECKELQINEIASPTDWKVKDISDVRKLKNLTYFRAYFPLNMVPDLRQLTSLNKIEIHGTEENKIDIRYAKLKNLDHVSIGLNWIDGVSNNMDILNQFTQVSVLGISNHYKKTPALLDYCLDFSEASHGLKIKKYGFLNNGLRTSIPSKVKHLLQLEKLTLYEKNDISGDGFDYTFPLRSGETENTKLKEMYIGGNWTKSIKVKNYPNIEVLPNFEKLTFWYTNYNQVTLTANMDKFYTYFFTKVYNPASGHAHHNSSKAVGFIHPKFRYFQIQPTFIPPIHWHRDKHQEILRTGFNLDASAILNPLAVFAPSSGDWALNLNLDVTTRGSITKVPGGTGNNAGGALLPMLGQWKDCQIEAKPMQEDSSCYLGLTTNSQTTIDHASIKYGIHLRSNTNANQQVQFIKDGAVAHSIDMTVKADKLWWVKRENGKITAGYDTTTVHTFKNADTSDVQDLSDLKVMFVTPSIGQGFSDIKLKN